MPADAVAILAVGLAPELRLLATEAARSTWPRARLIACGGAAEAVRRVPDGESEIAVVSATAPTGERDRLAAAVGRDGLPRWPVIVLGGESASDGILAVPGGLQSVPALRFVFSLALHQHAVVREARRAEGDLRTIARRISHEIRSPIGCILTSADVIREELQELVPAAVELARPVMDSARDVMGVVERLTLIARASSHPGALGPVDMHMAVWAAQERSHAILDKAGATVTQADDWPCVVGRQEWVEQIWLNLLSNAASHAGPRPRIELGWTRSGGVVRFHVRDSGPGVPPELAGRLFQPFHTLHQTDSGRGLGLAIVQRLVELQCGSTGYEPAAPHGACFHFTLRELDPVQGNLPDLRP